jgi:hypothetical protein
MRGSKWIRVRSLDVSDFRFIRRLASKQANFTVPPLYILWLLKQTNSRSCIVAEHLSLGRVAYLLSLIVSTPKGKVLYVWQVAASKRGQQAGATNVLLLALRAFMHRRRVQRVFFTSVPDSPHFRAIRRYAYALFGAAPRSQQTLPASVSRNEREFVIRVVTGSVDKRA